MEGGGAQCSTFDSSTPVSHFPFFSPAFSFSTTLGHILLARFAFSLIKVTPSIVVYQTSVQPFMLAYCC